MTSLEFQRLRTSARCTQKEWGALLGLCERHVRRIEAGQQKIGRALAIAARTVAQGAAA